MSKSYTDLIARIMLWMATPYFLGACSPSPSSSKVKSMNDSVKMSGCVTIAENLADFEDVLPVLERFANKHSMKLLNEKPLHTSRVNIQGSDPYITIIYSRIKLFGNLVEVFRENGEAQTLETELFESLEGLALLGDCGQYTSSIPKNWRLK